MDFDTKKKLTVVLWDTSYGWDLYLNHKNGFNSYNIVSNDFWIEKK